MTVVRSLESLVQCVFLDIGSPGSQLIYLHEDGINLVVFQGVRHLKIVPGKFQVVFGSLSAGRFHLAELAVVSGSKFAFALHSQKSGGSESVLCPFQEFFLTHSVDTDIFTAGLVDRHLHSVDVVDAIKHGEDSKAVAHKLRIATELFGFSGNQDSETVLVVDDLSSSVCQDDAVGSSGTAFDPFGEVHLLFDEDFRVGAGLLRLFIFLHDEGSVAFRALLHFGIVVVQVLSRVFDIPAESLFYKVGTQFMGTGTLLCVGTGLIRNLRTQLCGWRAVQPAVGS